MKKLLVMLLLPLIFTDCGRKKTKLADEDTVEINDFVEFFPDINLPFEINDSVLNRKETDSASIGYKIFTQFVPDTLLQKPFGKSVKPNLYPLGRVSIKKYETYLFLKASTAAKKAGYILAFDKDNKFITGMPLVVMDKDATTHQSGAMDAKYTVTQTTHKKKADDQVNEAKNAYILNAEARAFSMIMTDAGISDLPQEVINPIDTFAHRNKYTGDYIKDKRNYISFRDGDSPADLLFFVHFEKDAGNCTGELKGEATLQGPRTAVFRAVGNPCALEFTFTDNAVSMKETTACGLYRNIKCFFDGSYPKKKEPRAKIPGKKNS